MKAHKGWAPSATRGVPGVVDSMAQIIVAVVVTDRATVVKQVEMMLQQAKENVREKAGRDT